MSQIAITIALEHLHQEEEEQEDGPMQLYKLISRLIKPRVESM